MITGFELYSLGAWSDENGLMRSGKAHKTATHQTKDRVRRSGKWSFIVSGVIGAACLAISTVLLPPTSSSAVTISTLAPDIHDLDLAEPNSIQTVAGSPIREINKAFNNLFDSARAGQTLIPSDGIRLLARKALQSQKESVDIDSWAQKLAGDVKDAND